MSVHIDITTHWGRFLQEDADQVLASTRHFPYWAVWDKVGEDGQQTVHFIPEREIRRVSLTGEPEADENGKPDLRVINLSDHRPESA